MSSLKERIDLLESDLMAVPLRINVYHDLPFAIVRYDPTEEWDLRREVKLLATRLEAIGKEIQEVRMSELLWQAIDETEGLDEVIGLEQSRGYLAAQDQVTTYLRHYFTIPFCRPTSGWMPCGSKWPVSFADFSKTNLNSASSPLWQR
jgi:hypothetical protein